MLSAKQYKYLGLFIALVMPILLSFVHIKPAKEQLTNFILKELIVWTMFTLLMLIVKYGEKEPLIFYYKENGLGSSVGFGIVIMIAMYLVAIIFMMIYMAMFKKHPPHEDLSVTLHNLPAWFRVLLSVRAGVFEEVFFRAYAITRLMQLTKSRVISVIIPLTIFALGHAAYGTVYHVVAAFCYGIVLTAFYLGLRNLLANIIGHTLFDAVALLLPYR